MITWLETLWKLNKPLLSWMLLAVFLGFLTIASNTGLMMAAAYIIAYAALHPSIADLQIAIVGVRVFGVSRGIFRYLERLVSHHVNLHLVGKLREWFYSRLEPIVPFTNLHYKSSDLYIRWHGDMEILEHVFVRVISPPLVAAALSFLMCVLLGTLYLEIVVTFLVAYGLAGWIVPGITYYLSKKLLKKSSTIHNKLYEHLMDYFQGQIELQVYGMLESKTRNMKKLEREWMRAQQALSRIEGWYEGAILFVLHGCIIVSFILIAPNVEFSIFEGVYLTVVLMGIMASFEAYFPIPASIHHAIKQLEAGKRITHVSLPGEMKLQMNYHPEHCIEYHSKIQHITLEHVNYRYPNSNNLVIHDISLHIHSGEPVFIVGASGSGKSTLLNLLQGFYQPSSGTIYLNDTPLSKLNMESIRSQLSIVSQDIHLFNGTIIENLLLGKDNAALDECISICKQVQLHNFIETLEHKYHTWIGEHGLLLSAGQRQRLTIARALLRHSEILLLDEPTAHLDSKLSMTIMNLFSTYFRSCISIVCTHKLMELHNAKHIYVLDKGRIAEYGSFNSLIKKQGFFFSLYKRQQQGTIIQQAIE